MWAECAKSRGRCGGGEPSPAADVAAVSPVPLQDARGICARRWRCWSGWSTREATALLPLVRCGARTHRAVHTCARDRTRTQTAHMRAHRTRTHTRIQAHARTRTHTRTDTQCGRPASTRRCQLALYCVSPPRTLPASLRITSPLSCLQNAQPNTHTHDLAHARTHTHTQTHTHPPPPPLNSARGPH
jgi:hypothetical protein